MQSVKPMRLLRIPEPFDHPDWIFEPKMDGFRALAHVKGHHCTLICRNGHTVKSSPQLAEQIAHSVRADSAILDGEICCLNPDGTSNELLAVGGQTGVVRAAARRLVAAWVA